MFKRKLSRILSKGTPPVTSPIAVSDENQDENRPKAPRMDAFEEIPPSQSPDTTQASIQQRRRFLSQRSNRTDRSSLRTQSQLGTPSSLTYLGALLAQCGVREGEMFEIDSNSFIVFDKLQRAVTQAAEYPANLDRILSCLETALRDPKKARKYLAGCVLVLNGEATTKKVLPEGLIILLFSLPDLQDRLLALLLERMKFFATDESSREHLQLFGLVLSQIILLKGAKVSERVLDAVLAVLNRPLASVRCPIIDNLTRLVDSPHQDIVVRKIIELMPDNAELLVAENLAAFSKAVLNGETLKDIRSRIMAFSPTAPKALLPAFVDFLLNRYRSVVDHKQAVDDLRNLNYDLTAERPEKANTIRKLVFDHFERNLRLSKTLFDAWLKTIQNIDTAQELRPIDLLVLLIMMTANEERRRSVELMFKKKIVDEEFTIALFEMMIRLFPNTVKVHTASLVHLLNHLLRDRNADVSLFGIQAYRAVFSIPGVDAVLLITNIAGLIALKAPGSPFGASVRTVALRLLDELKDAHLPQLQANHAHLIDVVFDSPDLTIDQYRLATNVMCSLAYPPREASQHLEDNETLQTVLQMVIRKQMTNTDSYFQRCGIIGGVRMLDHQIWNWADETEQGEDILMNGSSSLVFESVSQIPEGVGRKMGKFFQYMHNSALRNMETLSLCFDELTAVFSPRNKRLGASINQPFLIWLYDFLLKSFQDNFVVTDPPTSVGGYQLATKFDINDPLDYSESNAAIAIDLSLALRPRESLKVTQAPAIIFPHFSLLRMVIFRRSNGSLGPIDALLGCGVLLPAGFDQVAAHFAQESNESKRKILDSHFLLANWYREVVSAFVAQPDQKMKVRERLTALISVEGTIRFLLDTAPVGYEPPDVNFVEQKPDVSKGTRAGTSGGGGGGSTGSKKVTGKAKGRKKKDGVITQAPESQGVSQFARTMNQSVGNLPIPDTQDMPGIAAGSATTRIRTTDLSTTFPYAIREMDPEIMLLLRDSFTPSYPTPAGFEGLGLAELRFVLADLVVKLESIAGVKKFAAKQSIQNLIAPEGFISDIIENLSFVMQHFRHLMNNVLRPALDEHEPDSPEFFTDQMVHVKVVVGLCLRLLAALLSWSGFVEPKNEKKLLRVLNVVAEGSIFSPESCVQTLASKALDKVIAYAETVQDLRSAVHLFHLARHLAKKSDATEAQGKTVQLCEKLLRTRWLALDGAAEQGAQCNVLLDELLKGLMLGAALPMVEEKIRLFAAEFKTLTKKDHILDTYPNFSKMNAPLLFRALANALVTAVVQSSDDFCQTQEQLAAWQQGYDLLLVLRDIASGANALRFFVVFTKYANELNKAFLRVGMRPIERLIQTEPARVVKVIETMQKGTRFLHALCNTAHVNNNRALLTLTPAVRETLENMINRIRGLLAANKLERHLDVRQLKNRDVHGIPILSQISTTDGDGDGSSTGAGGEEEDGLSVLDEKDDSDVDGSDDEETDSRSEADSLSTLIE